MVALSGIVVEGCLFNLRVFACVVIWLFPVRFVQYDLRGFFWGSGADFGGVCWSWLVSLPIFGAIGGVGLWAVIVCGYVGWRLSLVVLRLLLLCGVLLWWHVGG